MGRQRKKEEKAKRKANSKRPAWTPYLMWSVRKRKKLMAKHPEWNFAEVSKAISEGAEEDKKSEKTLKREERQRKKEEKAKRKANSKRPAWTPYLMWSVRRRKKLMVKHPEWNFAEVSKAISEGWKEVSMEEVERLE